MSSPFNGTKQIETAMKTGEVVGLVLGLAMFGIAIYSFSLSIKANRMAIRRFEEEEKAKASKKGNG